MKKSMKLRIVLGLTMAVVVLGGLWLDWFLQARADFRLTALPMAILLAGIAALAFVELSRMAGASGVGMLWVSGLAGAAAVATMPAWSQWAHLTGATLLAMLGLITMAIFVEQMIRHRVSDALRRIACTSLAVMYVGVGLALMLLIRTHWGVPVLVLFLAAVKLTDVGAYFTGSAIGKHKLILWLSPGKSWEGLIGGIIIAAGACVLTTWLLQIDVFGLPLGSASTVGRTMLFGTVVGAAGQLADLCESLLKRSSGLKDSGALLPEFGGILDIIDSPLLAAPVAIILLNCL
jgi:phosphatidate cytidylyltransferase